ncbi:hypothetical protein CPB84DRAFT_442673 [Gymnopilus junonius]|uniref:Uncharacterized protein n=1 Tax=Gymnopilus junonius TaxID=109634 RepID=A0A9P5TGP7_GYMJU|nr:hypothetical protein CPB84DRAFT_442673 [Gymnopilus junonius]
MMNRQYLCCLISRGAPIICASNQRRVDIVIPILFGYYLKPGCVSAFLIRVKNDSSFTDNVRTSLFTLMDPFKIGLFSKRDQATFPIIHMVFALASENSAVTRPRSRNAVLALSIRMTCTLHTISGWLVRPASLLATSPNTAAACTQDFCNTHQWLRLI